MDKERKTKDPIHCKDCGYCVRRMWDYACEKDGPPGKAVDPEYHCGDAVRSSRRLIGAK